MRCEVRRLWALNSRLGCTQFQSGFGSWQTMTPERSCVPCKVLGSCVLPDSRDSPCDICGARMWQPFYHLLWA